MKYISISEVVSQEAIKKFAEEYNLNGYIAQDYHHPQEDFLIASDTPPVFVVADGVTLDVRKLIEKNQNYPNPSPAGDVARIFCEAVYKRAKELYGTLKDSDLIDIFNYANKEVADYNQKIGKSDISGNITGFYSTTGAFAILKDNQVFWASICDSFIAQFDKEMNLKFMTSGLCQPYAVINGEKRMADHLEKGILNLEQGDRIFLFTDGFEHYIQNLDFISLFKNWDGTFKERIAKFSKEANLKDPEKYGHERSLIAAVLV